MNIGKVGIALGIGFIVILTGRSIKQEIRIKRLEDIARLQNEANHQLLNALKFLLSTDVSQQFELEELKIVLENQ